MTVRYGLTIRGLPVVVTLSMSGGPDGALRIVVTGVSVCGFDPFGCLKAIAVKQIVQRLQAANIIANQSGSTLTASLPGVAFL